MSCFKTFPISFIHVCVIVLERKSLTHMPFNYTLWHSSSAYIFTISYMICIALWHEIDFNFHFICLHLVILRFLKITEISRINDNIKESLLVINGELLSDVEPHSRLLKTFIIYF